MLAQKANKVSLSKLSALIEEDFAKRREFEEYKNTIKGKISKIQSEFSDHTKMLDFMNEDLKTRILKEVHLATVDLKKSVFEEDSRRGPNSNFSPNSGFENFVTLKEIKHMLLDKTNI